jgi:hypothetical protein
MRSIHYILISLFFAGCGSSRQMRQSPTPIALFKTIIVGDFDNSRQIAEERQQGQQVHPAARHVNRIANDKIINLPDLKSGFFVLEESYYEYPGKPVEVKPYLFFFAPVGDTMVQLTVYQIPGTLEKAMVRNDNPDLRFDYNTLQHSPTFKGALYRYHPADGTFTTNTPNELGNGLRFTLIETLSAQRLVVMELLEKNGQRITPYATPILYDRKK